jgi:2-dehydro-3-deoxyphosphogluconate aldolase / (4S)-4-hydroxy-2-oxoglutarate aldolase
MMKTQFGIRELLGKHPIIPVVNIVELDQVEGVIQQLHEKGIHCIEITLRSEVAMEAVEIALGIAPKGFDIGVGTIVSVDQVVACRKMGVDFLVSPGLTAELAKAFENCGTPFLPGVMTPSEIIEAQRHGYDTLKLFPFNIAGGLAALKAYGQVFPAVGFCPTGGINERSFKEVAASPNVISVGGSWLLK